MQTDVQPSVRTETPRRQRLRYFDHFRAVTILLVVASHSYAGWRRDSILEISAANLITGATALFVFISGFFFHHAFHRNFHYGRFMRKKTVAVLVPYLVLSTAFMLDTLRKGGAITYDVRFSDDPWVDGVAAALAKYATGNAHYVYWYVPFIMLMFALSPVFLRFIDLKLRSQVLLVVGALTLASFVWRSRLSLNPLHSVLYFVGFYLLGILFSLHRERVERAFTRTSAAVLWTLTVLVAVASAFAGQVGNMHKENPWEYTGFDWMVPLKVAMIAAMLASAFLFAKRESRVLGHLAKTSFAIFFVHPWFIEPMKQLVPERLLGDASGAAVLFLLVLGATLATIALVKAILGDCSRYVIGY